MDVLEDWLNKHGIDNALNVPDYRLAQFVKYGVVGGFWFTVGFLVGGGLA